VHCDSNPLGEPMTTVTSIKAPLHTAVLFLVFNRPGTTAKVFEAIREAQPPRLYIAADGPREGRVDEVEHVSRVRAIATEVDWPCDVKTLFREKNLGCKYAVSGAISWFFEQEQQGIILEDDCLPHPDFFPFCETLLNRFRDDERVSVITGNNFQNGRRHGEASYYFSKYNHCWGWASWRRAWRHYRGDLQFWPEYNTSDDWRRHIPDKVERRYWEKIFDSTHAGETNSWAYPWIASVWYCGGLTATPNVNLVSNIGFGPNSTHTKSAGSPLAEVATSAIGDLSHPRVIIHNQVADDYVFDNVFDGRTQRFPRLLFNLPRRTLSLVCRTLKRFFA